MQAHRPSPSVPSVVLVVLIGLVALASAMGVGRFAFTPLLPLMQAHDSLSLGQGAWLAVANYLGYGVGALACSVVPPLPGRAVRLGLVAVAAFTLAMGLPGGIHAWLAWRFAAGVASAYVLVGVSAWALPALAAQGRAAASGWVFAGVGVGIAAAGWTVRVAGVDHIEPASVWRLLGAASAVVAAIAWVALRGDGAALPVRAQPCGAREWRLVVCYAGFGFGYIIPATFLPAMAREAIGDAAVFGWIWPVFGATAAASTVIVARFARGAPPRRIWAASQVVMAVGVLAPLLWPGLAGLLAAAVCVGGTFMVATMAGMQEARRIADASAPRLMAAMTAGFALGQLAGPVVVAFAASYGPVGIAAPSVLAVLFLLVGAGSLWRPEPPAFPPTVLEPERSRR
jgi:MFS family permease